MKQTLKSIFGVGAIALLFYILFSVLNFAQSATPDATKPLQKEPELKTPQYDLNFLTPRSVPLFCGATGFVFQTAFEIFGEYPLAGSEVRSKGNLDNPIVAMITFTYNPKWNKGTLLMTIPETGETCILGYGVNWEFYNGFEPSGRQILDEGNESK